MSVTAKSMLLSNEALVSIINPEGYRGFEYLSRYLAYTKIEKIITKERIEDLIKKEKMLLDMISNSCQYKTTKLTSWGNYINWVCQLIPETYKERLRPFVTLETYTQAMLTETVFYSSKDYLMYWIYYIDMCRDDIDVLHYLLKQQICTRNYLLYESMAVIYEKFHEFRRANKCYLDGFDAKVDNVLELQQKYSKFEIRMENRINREIAQSCLSNEMIQKRLLNDIQKVNEPRFNDNKKRALPSNSITLTFIIKDNQIRFIPSTNCNDDKQNPTVNYGSIPVFVDEAFRPNLITKGSQLVEIYLFLVAFLLEKDLKFKEQDESFKKGLKTEYEKRPYSWISSKRAITGVQSLVNSSINDSKEDNTNANAQKSIKQLNVDTVVSKLEEEISQSSIKEKQKKELPAKPIEPPQPQPQAISQLPTQTSALVTPSIPSLLGRKEIKVMRIKTKDNETLLDLRIAYYKQKLEELEKTKKEEAEKLGQIDREKNFKLDSDGDICMSSDNEEDATRNSKATLIQKAEVKPVQVISSQQSTTGNTQPITAINNQTKKQKSPPPKKNLFTDLADLEPLRKEDLKKKTTIKTDTVINPPLNPTKKAILDQLAKSMTIDEVNDTTNDINKKFKKGEISFETRNKYFSILEEKVVQLEKATSSKPPEPEPNPLEMYINPPPSKQAASIPVTKQPTVLQSDNNLNVAKFYQQPQREAVRAPRQPNFNAIKPLEPKELQPKHANPNPHNNPPNQALITPEKKDFSISFDSNHSHLFKENKTSFEENNRLLMNFSDTFNKDTTPIDHKAKEANDLNQFFNEEDFAVHKVNTGRLAQIFMQDDDSIRNDEDNNSRSIIKGNEQNRMSSITEKTIEHTRNSSVNSMSIEKIFKS